MIFDGRTLRFSYSLSIIASSTEHSSSISSYTVFSACSLSIPSPLVVFPCGSISTTSTFFPSSAREAARLIAVVVLPTPPFWLATTIVLSIKYSPFVSSSYQMLLCFTCICPEHKVFFNYSTSFFRYPVLSIPKSWKCFT